MVLLLSAGFILVPRPDPYRPVLFKRPMESIYRPYIDSYRQFIRVQLEMLPALFEPAQGGRLFFLEDFFPKLQPIM